MPHWQDQYAANYHQWHQSTHAGQVQLYRPMGLVETSFDSDGLYHEGRADISALLELEVRSGLSPSQLRQRLLLAWTALRLQHVLLMAKAVSRQSHMTAALRGRISDRVFLLQLPGGADEAVQSAAMDVTFIEDWQADVDVAGLFRHAQNTARIVDPQRNLARLFVLPVESTSRGKAKLRFIFVMGHQISDGLTNYTWLSHFIKLLNLPLADIKGTIASSIGLAAIQKRLPLPQEDLYPPITGTKARQRWFWAMTVVLRHVKTPQPPAFSNPLYRSQPLAAAQNMPPTYDKLLDYSKVPPLNTFTVSAVVDKTSTARLHRMCREAGASIGAGCFVLVSMVMMSLHESRHPDIPAAARRPFIGSFPINPRPFFNHASAPDSLMLAFSDGVVLPFLPSSLPLEARFKLLVRQAHRQLSIYQKRPRAAASAADLKAHMTSRGAGRVIAINYISAMERLHAKLPPHLREQLGLASHSPQGSLAVRANPTLATCGVSSVGKSAWRAGEFDVDKELRAGGDDAFAADFRRVMQNVRARDGEFLVGVGGDEGGIGANVSYDGNAVDEQLVLEWKRRMETILRDDGERAKL